MNRHNRRLKYTTSALLAYVNPSPAELAAGDDWAQRVYGPGYKMFPSIDAVIAAYICGRRESEGTPDATSQG